MSKELTPASGAHAPLHPISSSSCSCPEEHSYQAPSTSCGDGAMNISETRTHALRLERMRSSPLWSRNGFRNIHPVLPGLRDPSVRPPVLEVLFGGRAFAPHVPLPSVDPRHSWSRAPDSGLRATWLGHSTVLFEIDGYRVLTDPVWGLRASPSRFLGPRRFQPVPIALQALPHLDAVIVSHDHYDHLDYPTVRELAKLGVPFITSLGVGMHLERWGVPPERIVELDWWESHLLPNSGLSITAGPAQHFSGRGLRDRNATLWSSMIVRSPRHSVFFSGDTGLTTQYGAIRERFGRFDLVMLEVGGHHPSWGDVHLGPTNALEALALLGGGALLPVHWGTFALSTHDWTQPAETLLRHAAKKGAQLVMPHLGEPIEPAHAREATPWWRDLYVAADATWTSAIRQAAEH